MTEVTPRATGLYLQVYQSPLEKASRMMKIAKSVHETGLFKETRLVGVQVGTLPAHEYVAEGVTIDRLKGSSRRGNLGRILRVLLWQPRVYMDYRGRRVAVVAAHNVWVLPLCAALARATGADLVYNAHELETETISMHGVKKRVAKIIESSLIKRCAIVSVVNQPIAEWYANAYDLPKPVVVGNIPEVVDAEVDFRKRLGVAEDEMLYVHTGHLVEGRSIPAILEAFSQTSHHLVFLGDGHLRSHVTDYAARFPNIHWVPPVEPHLIVAHVREADVGLCLIEHQLDLSDRLSSPNKLLEALAAGIPALCTDLVEARRHLGNTAPHWILKNPRTDLGAALSRIGKEDVRAFSAAWPGLHDWTAEVAPLQRAFRAIGGPAAANQ